MTSRAGPPRARGRGYIQSPLRGEMRASPQAINEKTHRLVAIQDKVERNSQAIARPKAL